MLGAQATGVLFELKAYLIVIQEGSDAERLWRACRLAMPPLVQAVMKQVPIACPGPLSAEMRLELLIRTLDRGAEAYAASCLGDRGGHEVGHDVLAFYARPRRLTFEEVYEQFSAGSSAIHEVAGSLSIEPAGSPTTPPAVDPDEDLQMVDWCGLCWRTGHRTRSGAFRCTEHAPKAEAYWQALRIRHWRSPSQPHDICISYERQEFRRLKRLQPYGLAPDDPSYRLISDIQKGDFGKVCSGLIF